MAGKKKKALLHDKKMKAKRAAKAARRAKYEALAGSPANKKRKRRIAKAGVGFCKYDHPDGPCGNIGCRKCFPKVAKLSDRRLRRWHYPVEEQRRNPW